MVRSPRKEQRNYSVIGVDAATIRSTVRSNADGHDEGGSETARLVLLAGGRERDNETEAH